jgi:hypothetical protein
MAWGAGYGGRTQAAHCQHTAGLRGRLSIWEPHTHFFSTFPNALDSKKNDGRKHQGFFFTAKNKLKDCTSSEE